MAEAQKSGDQSMDDILASIRRIISDDPISPVPAADNARAQSEPGVGATSGVSTAGVSTAQTVNPSQADDLSDILEPSAVHRAVAGGDGMAMTGGSEARGGEVQETTSWAFDAGGEATESGGSLKSKLASLDSASQTAVSLEPVAPRNGGISLSVMPDTEALKGKQNVDGPIDDGSTAIRTDVTGDDRVETPKVVAESVHGGSKPVARGAVSVASVEVAVEQHTAEPQRASERAMPAQTMTAEAVIADIKKQEMQGSPVASEPNVASVADREAATMVDETGSPAAAVASYKPTPVVAVDGGKTLEAMVVEALQPMLREWLDANLPRLVEERLQAETEQLARNGKLKSG